MKGITNLGCRWLLEVPVLAQSMLSISTTMPVLASRPYPVGPPRVETARNSALQCSTFAIGFLWTVTSPTGRVGELNFCNVEDHDTASNRLPRVVVHMVVVGLEVPLPILHSLAMFGHDRLDFYGDLDC